MFAGKYPHSNRKQGIKSWTAWEDMQSLVELHLPESLKIDHPYERSNKRIEWWDQSVHLWDNKEAMNMLGTFHASITQSKKRSCYSMIMLVINHLKHHNALKILHTFCTYKKWQKQKGKKSVAKMKPAWHLQHCQDKNRQIAVCFIIGHCVLLQKVVCVIKLQTCSVFPTVMKYKSKEFSAITSPALRNGGSGESPEGASRIDKE